MKIRIIGCGEAFDSGVGNNSCLLQGRSIPTLLFDCGYQIPERLWAAGLHDRIEAAYISHIHADHAFGLVPLLTRWHLEGRRKKFTIIGHSGIEPYLKRAFDLGYPGMRRKLRFPLRFLTVRPGKSLRWRQMRFHTARSDHSVRNLSVRVELPGTKEFAFSGDGTLNPAMERLFAGVPVLLQEVFSLKREVPGHTSLARLKNYAADSGIGRIIVTHHGREERRRIAAAVHRLQRQRGGPQWISARPDMQVSL